MTHYLPPMCAAKSLLMGWSLRGNDSYPRNLPDIVRVIDIQRAKTMTRQSHDEWFLEQVRQALIEADDPLTDWVPHEIVKTDMQRQREALLERILHRQSALSSPRPRR
ncbi:hypothetical protein QDD82_000011 [Burkholderia cepacia]|uniref:hypothetical protein n=2 Tax=Burkholderiaceae TaxID=119060 RepID=UPI00158BE7D9|nr:hypothetical protein [Burkholderia cenocepacia]EKS9839256.1 hypothetical protein [Burkholderia cepacia]